MKNSTCLSSLIGMFTLATLADAQVINEDAKLLASDGAFSDGFSRSIAIGEGLVVIGSPEDDDNGVNSGSAYLFNTTGSQIAKLVSSNGRPFDAFGGAVAISDGVIAIGAYYADSVPEILGGGDGAVYLFDSSGVEFAELTPNDPAGFFGRSIASDNGLIVVGANTDNELGPQSGAAYLFDMQGNEIAKITAADGAPYDRFGSDVAIDSEVLVVAAPLDDDNGLDSGAVYLFNPSGVQFTKLTADDGSERDGFGGQLLLVLELLQ